MFLLFVLLYLHTWRQLTAMELSPKECCVTIERLGANVYFVSIGLLSTAILIIGGPAYAGASGMIIAAVLTVYFSMMGTRFRKMGFDRE